MPKTRFTCEYQRLATEILSDLSTTARILGMVDVWCGEHFAMICGQYRRRLRDLHMKQEREQAGNPPGPGGLTGDEIVAVEVLARSVLSQGS